MCKSPLNINSRLVYIFLKMVELVSRFLVIVIEGCSNLLSTSNLWSSTPFWFICLLCNLYFSFGMLEKIAVNLVKLDKGKPSFLDVNFFNSVVDRSNRSI